MVSALPRRRRGWALALLACALAHASDGRAETVTQVLTVRAAITPGCWFGTSRTPLLSLGTIDFGTVPRLDKDVKTKSSVGAGTIVMTCTPGTQFRVDINDGSNTSGMLMWYSGRQLKHAASGNVLKYDLYRDSGYSQRWGTGGEGVQMTATGGPIELPVYAKLQSTTTQPTPGVYTDDLIVTVYY